MAYSPNIPLANEKLSQSQPNILNNFAAIANVLNPDNGTIKLPIQIAAQGTAAGQISLYSKTGNGVPAVQSLFWREANNGPEHDMASCMPAANGWTILPSGKMIQWGKANVGGASTVALPKPFPSNFFTVTVSEEDRGGLARTFCQATPNGLASFSARNIKDGGGLEATLIYWIAIGM
jgi:hypothetical protein